MLSETQRELRTLLSSLAEETAQRVLVEYQLLRAEPVLPPKDLRERAAWEGRLRGRQGTVRAGVAFLAQIGAANAHVQDGGEGGTRTDD